ncbi:unnamed protein product [Spirodela intermedia]|uniref:Uncharacterized protein n=1 Tax=Spirodela intermedia TaxID=51605 RepID=A0A7I8LHM0_SPIIN|nr:unnamed protein product [Spirodela intermedia]
MSSETEPAKALLPYLQRADELQKHEPLVAYYCRLYAMERGLKIPTKDRTKTTNSILVSLINQLEKDKKSLKLGPEDSLYVEGFASNVFAKADKQDRAGRADLNTAKTFYAASIFFETLYQFGELQPDIEQKQKYAAWKAADIRKALKEGRKPEPGPPGGDEDLSIPPTTAANVYDVGRPESSPFNPPPANASHHVDNINQQHSRENSPPPPSSYPGQGFPSTEAHQPPPATHRPESPTYSHPHLDQFYPSNQRATQSISPEDQSPPGHSFNGSTPLPLPPPPNCPSSYDGVRPHGGYPPHDRSFDNYPPHDGVSQHYPSHEAATGVSSPYTYPNFQTYPSFNDSNLPVVPTQHPSYYHGSDLAQPYQPPPPAPTYTSPGPTDASRRNGPLPATVSPAAAKYVYDSSYQPSVEKIAEAHKAARFAVGALAFDDVPVAVDFLQRSLELLTNPSAESH